MLREVMRHFLVDFRKPGQSRLGGPHLRAMTGYIVLSLLFVGVTPMVWAATAPDNANASAHNAGTSEALAHHVSDAPINVTSDKFAGNFETKVGTYTGNVIVTQADYKLRADQVRVNVVDGKPSRFDATGHVVFVSTSGTATGDNGIYELGPRVVTLTGHVVLTKDKDVMHGTALTVNMVTGESHLTAKGAPGNRVQGLFVQQPSNQKAAKPAGGVSK